MKTLPTSLIDIVIDYVATDLILPFLTQNLDKIQWREFCGNPGAPMSLVCAEINKKRIDWARLCGNPNAPMDFICSPENRQNINWSSLRRRLIWIPVIADRLALLYPEPTMPSKNIFFTRPNSVSSLLKTFPSLSHIPGSNHFDRHTENIEVSVSLWSKREDMSFCDWHWRLTRSTSRFVSVRRFVCIMVSKSISRKCSWDW